MASAKSNYGLTVEELQEELEDCAEKRDYFEELCIKLKEENEHLKINKEYVEKQSHSFATDILKMGNEIKELKEQIQKLQKYKEGLDTIAHKHGYTI